MMIPVFTVSFGNVNGDFKELTLKPSTQISATIAHAAAT